MVANPVRRVGNYDVELRKCLHDLINFLQIIVTQRQHINSDFIIRPSHRPCGLLIYLSRCFVGSVLRAEQLQREILKAFFTATPKDWDYLTVIVDGHVEAVSNSNADFAKAVDTGKIVPSGSFFRMFKPIPVDWYYKFAISPDTAPVSEPD
jgi:hypothetical protein